VDAERGASGPNSVGTPRSYHLGSWSVRLFVEVEVVAAEDSVVAVGGRVACVVKQCSEDLHGKGKKSEDGKSEQQKVALQGGVVTGIQA